MRSIRRRLPRISKLLVAVAFGLLLVSLAVYIGFTEKHPYSRKFAYFLHAAEVPQQTQNVSVTVTAHQEPSRPPNGMLRSTGSSLEQETAKSLIASNSLHAKETHAGDKDVTSTSTANVKHNEKSLMPTPNEVQARNGDVSLTANKDQGMGTLTLLFSPKEEKIKGGMPEPEAKKQAGFVRKQLEGKDVTALSSAQQTEKQISRKTDITEVTPKKRLKASDFKSEPSWDFDDQYLLDNSAPQSTCPDSLRVKAVKSDWLKDVFLPNITVFMDRNHFSDSEWERMEHFAPPFGFMELNYSLAKEVISMLPPKPYHQSLFGIHNSSQTSKCISCAVVGNGGIMNNSGMGQEIDSHDYVFRVSGAVIKGYEKDVGTRTSFYGFTAYSLVASLLTLGNHGFKKIPMGKEIKYLHFLEGTRDYEWLNALLQNKEIRKGFLAYTGARPRDKFDNNFSLDKYFVIHPDFLRYMKNRFLKSKSLDKSYWRLYRPTTGAFLLLTALHLCDQVSAYGYITEDYQKYSDHYYDKQWKRLIFYLNHDFDLERRVWKKLHDANIMKLYQRS